MKKCPWKLPEIKKGAFRFSTLSFIFILVYINVFQYIFGPENSTVGVIFTIMMSASMVRDLTATPFKHLIIQALILVWIALAAYWVNVLPALLSFFINFITISGILYTFTYEYSSHIYFPYILSYLFLVFISPSSAEQLPKRAAAMVAGAVSIMLYQWFMGRHRVSETARDVLSEMIDDICQSITYKLGKASTHPDPAETRSKLCRLSRTVYGRRKKVLCVSEASFSMIDAGRGLEHLMLLIQELPDDLGCQEQDFLSNIADRLDIFRSFLHQKIGNLPPMEPVVPFGGNSEKMARLFNSSLFYIHDRLLHMTDPQNRSHYPRTTLSLKIRLQAALNISPVRVIYALRVALLLSCATLLVQTLALPHGKWLLFTLASVSLPYADDVPVKIRRRTVATVIGGLVSVVIYSLIPSPAGRTAIMMLSGYISFYFTDYTETFACSTVGALGGAVFMDYFGFRAIGSVFIIRLGYTVAGIVVAYIINCLLFPYGREKATRHLWKKYKSVAGLLTKVCHADQDDPQLYYNLVIQAHLQEDMLVQNAKLEEWAELPELLQKCQEQIRLAHRTRIIERSGARVFEPGHLT